MARAARIIATTGLGAVGALHLNWARGSSWPFRAHAELGLAVAGSETMPPTAPTAAVGVALIGAGLVSGGLGGSGRGITNARLALAGILLLRAGLGGVLAARLLGLGEAGERFRRLDRWCYRPLCAGLGIAVMLAARSRE